MYKLIENFPNYKINVHGEILSRYKYKTSIISDEWRPVKHVLDKGIGYYLVTLVHEGKRKNCFIHRLVATAFIDNPENKPMVNHIDGDKTNNHINNLEWCTAKENSVHAVRTGLTTTDSIEKSVHQINLNTGDILNTFKSLKDAYNTTKIQSQNISKVCRGLRKQAGGFYWKYA